MHFVGYSKHVKGYRLLQPKSNYIIIRKYVKFYENILAYEPNSTLVPRLAFNPSSLIVPTSMSMILVLFLLQMMTVRMETRALSSSWVH